MTNGTFFPELGDEWEPTRATLHLYANAVGIIPRAHAAFHPRWWHISLKVRPDGLVTESFPLPGSGSAFVRMDLRSHEIVVESSDGRRSAVSMTAGLTGTEMGENLIALVAELGLEGEYVRTKFENDEARSYDPAQAERFFRAIVDVNEAFSEHRNSLVGPVGPIQIWPHGFDIAFEWFGTKTEEYEENGEVQTHHAQLNLGFYPGGRPYFYSNPWPFLAEKLVSVELPHGAEWHQEGWEGSILYYDLLHGDPAARQKLLDYAGAVYEAAAPTLSEDG